MMASLIDFGFATGRYANICSDCAGEFIGDKRAMRCEDCARSLQIKRTATDDLEAAIDSWVEFQIQTGNSVPDFWDELNTSEGLAEHLATLGYRKA